MVDKIDINALNRFLDRFLYRMYGIDIYVTPRGKRLQPRVLIFPEKVLKNSGGFDPSYYNVVSDYERLQYRIYGDSLRYFGFSEKQVYDLINDEHMIYVLSEDLGPYLTDYIERTLKFVNDAYPKIFSEVIGHPYEGEGVILENVYAGPIQHHSERDEMYIGVRLANVEDGHFFMRDYILEYFEKNFPGYDPQIPIWIS